MSGQVVKNHTLSKKKRLENNNETRRITCLSLSRACQPEVPARPRVHPPHRHSRTHAVGHWETSCEIPKKTEHTDPVQGSLLRDLPEWLGEFIDNLGVALGFGLGNEKIQEALDVLENFHRRDTHRGVPEVTLVLRSFSSRGWKATMLREEDETTLKG